MSINEAIDTLRDTIRERIESIYVYETPFDHLPAGEHTTPFGSITVPDDHTRRWYVCVKEDVYGAISVSPDSGLNLYCDFSYGRDSLVFKRVYNTNGSAYSEVGFTLVDPRMVIWPDYVQGLGGCNLHLIDTLSLCHGLYLPRAGSSMRSSWIHAYRVKYIASNSPIVSDSSEMTAWDIEVKCPVNTEIPLIYLQALSMTANTMVGIFNNLKDVSGSPYTYRVTVGSVNLAKLTTAQKNIAINKGWELA